MAQRKSIFAAITKVDVATRSVTGIAMQEVVDRSGEKCLYAESKPFFQAWSDTQQKASGGKSKGNVREMHTPSAVGVLSAMDCDDALKAFVVTAEIVDDAAWKKVEKGVYTGFSIGANFAAKPKLVDDVLEWVADPVEVSLVDIPCVPTALFELKDAAGAVHMMKFAAQSQKSMYSVSQMASALGDLRYMVAELEWEAQYENDGSQVPARLMAWMESGAEIFLDLAQEESSEFATLITSQKAARAARQKAGSACGCNCAGCSDCTNKTKAVQPKEAVMADVEKGTLTAEQVKAFTDGVEVLKTFGTQLEALKGVPDSVKAIAESQTGFDTRLKAIETSQKDFADFVEILSAEPAAAKTVSPVAVERNADVGNVETGKSALPKDGDNLTSDKAKRLEAFKAIHAE